MDVGAFFAAQLWLHSLPPGAWPAARDQDATNGDDRSRVILAGARCCLLLDTPMCAPANRGSGSSGNNGHRFASRQRHPLRLFLRSAVRARDRPAAVGYVEGGGGAVGKEVEMGREDDGRVDGAEGSDGGMCSEGWDGEDGLVDEFEFSLAISRGSGARKEGAAAGGGGCGGPR